jgi:fatty acid-binding protein DegV
MKGESMARTLVIAETLGKRYALHLEKIATSSGHAYAVRDYTKHRHTGTQIRNTLTAAVAAMQKRIVAAKYIDNINYLVRPNSYGVTACNQYGEQ